MYDPKSRYYIPSEIGFSNYVFFFGDTCCRTEMSTLEWDRDSPNR